MFVLVGVFMALGFGTCMSIGQAVCVKIVGQQKSAVGISTFFLLCDLGCSVAPVTWCNVLAATDYTTMFLICALCSVAAFVHYALASSTVASAVRSSNQDHPHSGWFALRV